MTFEEIFFQINVFMTVEYKARWKSGESIWVNFVCLSAFRESFGAFSPKNRDTSEFFDTRIDFFRKSLGQTFEKEFKLFVQFEI